MVGPPAEALRLGGDKLAAKRIAREAGVPTLPGGIARGDRLPARRQGCGGRRRTGDEGRSGSPAELADAESAAAARGSGRVRRRHALPRALPGAAPARRGTASGGRARHRRGARGTRLLGPAAAPEGARGGPSARPRSRRCARSCTRRRSRSAARSATAVPERSSSSSTAASSTSWSSTAGSRSSTR